MYSVTFCLTTFHALREDTSSINTVQTFHKGVKEVYAFTSKIGMVFAFTRDKEG